MTTYVYVDLQNVKRKKGMIDWDALRQNVGAFVSRKGHSGDLLIKAFYSKQEIKEMSSWFKPLSQRLSEKGIIGIERGSHKPKNHGADSKNVDVLMAVEVMEDVYRYRPEAVVLVTGDGDFSDLVARVQGYCPVYVYHPSKGSLSNALKTVANDFIG